MRQRLARRARPYLDAQFLDLPQGIEIGDLHGQRDFAALQNRLAQAIPRLPREVQATGVTVRDLLLARADQDTPALLTRERTWSWNRAESSSRPSPHDP